MQIIRTCNQCGVKFKTHALEAIACIPCLQINVGRMPGGKELIKEVNKILDESGLSVDVNTLD